MRKSKLVLAFLAATALTPLSACEKQPPQPAVYKTVDDCVHDQDEDGNFVHTLKECEDAFNTAKNSADAPRYTEKARCEAEFGSGHCEYRAGGAGGGGSFVPFMTGFMLGNITSGGGGYNHTTVVNHYVPVYSGSSGVYTGSRVSPSLGSSMGYSPSTRSFSSPRAFSGTTARGGFGASAAAHGGFSGG